MIFLFRTCGVHKDGGTWTRRSDARGPTTEVKTGKKCLRSVHCDWQWGALSPAPHPRAAAFCLRSIPVQASGVKSFLM